MSLLASVLIGVVGRRAAARFEEATRDPVVAQQRKLLEIMSRNRNTDYGRRYGFAEVRSLDDYRSSVPAVGYDDIREDVERMTRGERDVLIAEDPLMFAQTSGTTGRAKFIPVSPTCQGRDQADQMRTWLYHAKRAHPGMFKGRVVSLVSPAVEGRTPAGIPYGSTSGMIYRDMHPLVRRTYAVPYEVFEIKEYEAKYYAVMRLGLATDVTFLATANPSSVLQMVEAADARSDGLIRDLRDGTLSRDLDLPPEIRGAIEAHLAPDPARAQRLEESRRRRAGKLLPADYWPNLALIACWKGGTVGGYVERFTDWFDPDHRGMVPVRDWGYLSSEARGSIPLSDDGGGGVLTVSANVFEFVPTDDVEEQPDDRAAWRFRGVDEIETGGEYYVFLTTTGGLYRYDINDVVEVVDTYNRTPVIVFRRKGRGMTSITGEKLSVNQVIDAVANAGKTAGVSVDHFRVEPDPDNSHYVFKIEVQGGVAEDRGAALLRSIDEALSELNLEYKAKRASARLKPPVLQVMRAGWYERHKKRLAAEGKRLFQAKTVILDSKQSFEPEPDDLEAEVSLDGA